MLEAGDLLIAVKITINLRDESHPLVNRHITVGKGDGTKVERCHISLEIILQNFLLSVIVQWLLLNTTATLRIKFELAAFDNYFWSSFHEDANSLFKFRMLDNDDRFLEVAVEWNMGKHSSIFLSHFLMDWDFSILKPLDQRYFSALANGKVERVLGHLDVSLRVPHDALNNLVDNAGVELAVEESILASVKYVDILGVEVVHFHLFSGHSTSLTKAKICDKANLLYRCEVTD